MVYVQYYDGVLGSGGSGGLVRAALVRHGETAWNAENRFQGRKDLSLTDLGTKQARVAGIGLRGWDWEVIVTSPLVRARPSAAELAGILKLPVIVEEGLTERDFGEAEGALMADARTRWPEEDYPSAETLEQVGTRAWAAWEDLGLRYSGKHAVLVCHAVVIRMLMKRLQLASCFHDGGWTVVA